jgi:hypothetical protein
MDEISSALHGFLRHDRICSRRQGGSGEDARSFTGA